MEDILTLVRRTAMASLMGVLFASSTVWAETEYPLTIEHKFGTSVTFIESMGLDVMPAIELLTPSIERGIDGDPGTKVATAD